MRAAESTRRWRRSVLAAGVVCMSATAPRAQGTPTEGEVVAHGGSSAGGWICGPVARARYGGAAVRVEHGQRDEADTRRGGWTGIGTFAVERERLSLVRCDESDCALPPDRPMVGGSAMASFQSRVAGARLGGGLYQAWRSPRSTEPALAIYPEAELALRLDSPVRALIGIGSSVSTTVRRPGAYTGADLLFTPLTLELRLGVHRAGPAVFSAVAARGDAVVAYSLIPTIDLRLGASVSGGSRSAPGGGEASGGLRVRF
jgi:hypothetical protein